MVQGSWTRVDCQVSFLGHHAELVCPGPPSRLARLLPDSGVGHKSDGLRFEAQGINCGLKSITCDISFIRVPTKYREIEMHGV